MKEEEEIGEGARRRKNGEVEDGRGEEGIRGIRMKVGIGGEDEAKFEEESQEETEIRKKKIKAPRERMRREV